MSTSSTVRELLHKYGPLDVAQLLALAEGVEPVRTRKPQETVRNALQNTDGCQPMGDGRWVYLPAFLTGARVCVPMRLANPIRELVAVGLEADSLLWPTMDFKSPRTLRFDDGSTTQFTRTPSGWPVGGYAVIQLPPRFWHWWSQRGEPHHIVLSCRDGESGIYEVELPQPVGGTALQAANRRLEETAISILRRARGTCFMLYFGRRLLASGIYHDVPPPDPSPEVLYSSDSSVQIDGHNVIDLSRLSPTARKRAVATLEDERGIFRFIVSQALELPTLESIDVELKDTAGAVNDIYKLRVRLKWLPKVWRVIEITGDRTLEDLHLEIQAAFNWDDDHLYSFFMSGKRWDRLSEIAVRVPDSDSTSYTDEVRVGELDLEPRRKFLYLFDYGDQLEHDIQVMSVTKNPLGESFVRITEVHGEAPPQYPSWDEE